MAAEDTATLKLYTYWRSSAAYRVRIALNLKGLSFESIPIHLVRQGGEQHNEAYRSINPQGLVPVLVHGDRTITQSFAICEYLDESFPQYPLLPAGPNDRARVRSMALQIACEIHPLNNLRVQKYLAVACDESLDAAAWMSHWMGSGFEAIERQLGEWGDVHAGCLAERPGLFECFLVPQVYNADRYGLDMDPYPEISKIVKRCRELPEFLQAAPENQADAT